MPVFLGEGVNGLNTFSTISGGSLFVGVLIILAK
jgi:hypothetical protein